MNSTPQVNYCAYVLDWSKEATRYRWTINNFTTDDIEYLHTFTYADPNHVYTVYGIETGAEGTLHLQGYTVLKNKRRPKPFMAMMQSKKTTSKIFVFHCDAGHKPNIEYCKKQNDWKELGEMPEKNNGGKVMSTRWADFKNAVKRGATDEELADLDFALMNRSMRLVDRLRLQFKPVRQNPCRFILLCGDTGCGKTRWVNEKYPNHVRVPMMTDKKFWLDGWQATDKVLFWDEFCGQIPLASFLELTDPYYNIIKTPNKGSHVWFVPDLIILASNLHPSDWWSYTGREQQREALKRRIHEHGTIYVNNKRILPNAFWPFEKVYATRWSEYEEKCIDPTDDEVNAALAFYDTPQDNLDDSSSSEETMIINPVEPGPMRAELNNHISRVITNRDHSNLVEEAYNKAMAVENGDYYAQHIEENGDLADESSDSGSNDNYDGYLRKEDRDLNAESLGLYHLKYTKWWDII